MSSPNVSVNEFDSKVRKNMAKGKERFQATLIEDKDAIFWANVEPETVEKLKQLYRLDFEMFGFDADEYLERQRSKIHAVLNS